jgi:hypothetical protein
MSARVLSGKQSLPEKRERLFVHLDIVGAAQEVETSQCLSTSIKEDFKYKSIHLRKSHQNRLEGPASRFLAIGNTQCPYCLSPLHITCS